MATLVWVYSVWYPKLFDKSVYNRVGVWCVYTYINIRRVRCNVYTQLHSRNVQFYKR